MPGLVCSANRPPAITTPVASTPIHAGSGSRRAGIVRAATTRQVSAYRIASQGVFRSQCSDAAPTTNPRTDAQNPKRMRSPSNTWQ